LKIKCYRVYSVAKLIQNYLFQVALRQFVGDFLSASDGNSRMF